MDFGSDIKKLINAVGGLSKDNSSITIELEDLVFADISLNKKTREVLKANGGNVDKMLELLADIAPNSRVFNLKEMGMKPIKHVTIGIGEELRDLLNTSAYLLQHLLITDINMLDIYSVSYTLKSDIVKYFGMSGVKDFTKFLNEYCVANQLPDGVLYLLDLADEKILESDDTAATTESEDEVTDAGSIFGGMFGQPKQKLSLGDFCTDLIAESANHKEPLVGREKEIAQTVRILCRYKKANVLHLGEAGVGKTSVALGLADYIRTGKAPKNLADTKVYSLDVTAVMAGTKYRGDLEERMKFIMKELNKMGKVILYIDEIHMLMGGSGDGSLNMANLLKTSLTDGNIRFIGATTYKEYKNSIEKDAAFARRFKIVNIVEPSADEAKEILRGIIPYYAEYHGVSYADNAIDAAVDLSVKYIHDKYLPDKAIDLIDEAGASCNIKGVSSVTANVIEGIIAENCNIPKESVTSEDKSVLKNLDKRLKSVVFGQDSAIEECVKAVKLSRAGLTDANKPVASLLFVGQTGVGKTEIARQLASTLNIDFVKFDMSEYFDSTSVNKLIGASAGYVGYDDGGLLVEEIRKHPHCVLLLDEIEKAHPSVFNALLQVMDDARLTDNKGRMADFKNVIIIMTSNAGASGVKQMNIGFGESATTDYSQMNKAVEKTFTPEFRNRLTKIIVLNPMNEDMAKKIAKKQLDKLVSTLADKGVALTYTPSVVDYCVSHGITEEFGARPIIRVVNDDIKMLLVDELIDGTRKEFKLRVKDNAVTI